MYILYGTNPTGTCAVQAALEEIGAEYQWVEVSTKKGDHRTEEYRAINPRQQVPSLRLPDGAVLTEGPVILLHLADTFPQAGLAPPSGTAERAQHDRWLIFFAVNVYEGELRKTFPDRYTADPAGAEDVRRAADDYVGRHYRIFEDVLREGPYFRGPTLSMLDIYVWMLSQWLEQSWLSRECPKIAALAKTVARRPKIAPIHKANFD